MTPRPVVKLYRMLLVPDEVCAVYNHMGSLIRLH